jgi:hypothetical protein
MKITLWKSIFLLMIALLFAPSCTFPVLAAKPTDPATTPTPVINSTLTWIGDNTITPTLVISSMPYNSVKHRLLPNVNSGRE